MRSASLGGGSLSAATPLRRFTAPPRTRGDDLPRERNARQRRRTFRLVVDRDDHRLAGQRVARGQLGERRTRGRVLVDELVERLVLRLRLFVLETAVQAPAHDQRAGRIAVEQRERGRLAQRVRHARMQADAVANAERRKRPDEARREQAGVADLDRVARAVRLRRQRRQRREERGQPLDQRSRVGEQLIGHRRKLEHQHAGLLAQAIDARLHEFMRRERGVEERRVRSRRFAAPAAHHGVRHGRGRFHDEAEIVRHLLRVAQIVGHRQRAVERPVEAHAPEQRMRAIRAEPFARQLRLREVAVEDDAVPAGEVPRRRAEPHVRRQRGRQFGDLGGHRRRRHAAPAPRALRRCGRRRRLVPQQAGFRRGRFGVVGSARRRSISARRASFLRRRVLAGRFGIACGTGARARACIVGGRAEQVELRVGTRSRRPVALLSLRSRVAPRAAVTHACPA